MKKILLLSLSIIMILSITACSKADNTADTATKEPAKSNSTVSADKNAGTPDTYSDKSSAIITNEMAEEVALTHAGFKAEDVQYLKSHHEYDDLREIYEVEFYKDNYEYDYDIDAVSGEILSYDKDYDD